MQPLSLKLVLTLVAISGVFTLDVYLPGVPSTAKELSSTLGQINITFTAFAITFAFAQLILGPLSDHYGRKPILLLGLVLAVITTFLCAFAFAYWQLLILRILQALGVSSFVVLNAIVRDLHDGPQATRWRAYLAAVSGIAIAIAPAFGSLAVKYVGWQGTFLLSDIILFFTLITVLLCYQETCHKEKHYLRKVLHTYMQLFSRQGSFILHTIQAAFAYSVHFSFILLSPLIIIEQLHLSLSTYSVMMFIYGLSWLASGMLTSKLTYLLDSSSIIFAGCSILFVGTLSLFAFEIAVDINIYTLMCSILIMAVGAIMIRPTAITLSLSSIAKISGQAYAINNLIQFAFAGIIASLAGFYSRFALVSIGFLAIFTSFAVILIQYVIAKFFTTNSA